MDSLESFDNAFEGVKINQKIIKMILDKADVRPLQYRFLYDKTLEYLESGNSLYDCVDRAIDDLFSNHRKAEKLINDTLKAIR